MIIACERCSTHFVLRDELVPPSGGPVQCSQCGQVFTARQTAAQAPQPTSGRTVIIGCERCATHFSLEAELIPPSGALVQCTRCQHTFRFGGPPLPLVPAAARNDVRLFGLEAPSPPQAAAPGPIPRRDVMLFGANLPDPSSPPAESYRSAQGRMTFGSPLPGTAPAASPPPAIPGERQPRAPKTPVDGMDQMFARAAENPDDEQLLLVLSDALMERGDARGRLIAFMLEEERGSELMRRVKVNVLIRDNERNWAPPGAKITAFHRGLPSELEWSEATDPEHLAWRSAKKIHVTLERPPDESVFELTRPNLRSLTGLTAELMSHVLSLPPKGLRELSGRFRRSHLVQLAHALGRFPQLEALSLQTVPQASDERLTPEHIVSLVPGASRLKRLRISLPRVSIRELDLVRQRFSPQLDLKFLVPLNHLAAQTTMLHLDLAQRALLLSDHRRTVQAELLGRDLSEFLGERLTIVRV